MTDIFVFGSNLLGIHKKGAALHALRQHGAILGQGIGLQGKSYAIPTKENPRRSLDLVSINKFVADFLLFAAYTKDDCYMVSAIGCGLAGWQHNQIAPLFNMARDLKNIMLPKEFVPHLSWLINSEDRIAIFNDF